MRSIFLLCALALFLLAGIASSAKAPDTGVVRPSEETIYKVVINHEEAYSIWPADRENPLGWNDAGKTGTKEECLAWIREQGEKEKTPGPAKIKIPTQAQNGRNLELTGSFDGSAQTTVVTIDGQRAEVLEETASKTVVKVPSNLKGQVKVTVEEGSGRAEGTCNVINVDVTATKTNLLKGETAIVTVTVTGLDGIKRTIPLHLTTKGVINMEGGNAQLLRIHPGDVQGGRYTITRKITGRQAGGFDVTATIITQPWYIALVKDAKDNGWRVKKVGNGFVFNVDNVKDPVTGGLLEGEYVLETECVPGTLIKSLIPVLVKKGQAQISDPVCVDEVLIVMGKVGFNFIP
ncbi:MAG: MbtH family protein [Pyrinomonadaceae bacterium]